MLAGKDPGPVFLKLTEQITPRLQAREPVAAGDVVDCYPQWAGAIYELLPTMHDLVGYGRLSSPTACVNDTRKTQSTPTITDPE